MSATDVLAGVIFAAMLIWAIWRVRRMWTGTQKDAWDDLGEHHWPRWRRSFPIGTAALVLLTVSALLGAGANATGGAVRVTLTLVGAVCGVGVLIAAVLTVTVVYLGRPRRLLPPAARHDQTRRAAH